MEKLINELIKAGCSRDRLEIKVFGGGNVIDSSNAIGTTTPNSCCAISKPKGCAASRQDLGGTHPRRIHYYPATGRVVRRLLGTGETVRDQPRRAGVRQPTDVAAARGRNRAFWRCGVTTWHTGAGSRSSTIRRVMRQLLSTLLSADPEIEVVGTAPDPHVAREQIKALNPDVVTLDVEMPHMDGVTFLRKIMTLRPMPVVMISTLTQAGAEITLEALEIGAVDFIAKPYPASRQCAWPRWPRELQTKVKAAARARMACVARRPRHPRPRSLGRARTGASGKIVVIGASTGGVEALKDVLMGLPADCPPILITQHMPPRFTAAFAERLNRECPMTVSEAMHDEVIEPGHVYIAPGSHHLELHPQRRSRHAAGYPTAPPVSGHRPVGRRAVPVGGARRRTIGGRGDPHRHGQGRRRGPARTAPGRRPRRSARTRSRR